MLTFNKFSIREYFDTKIIADQQIAWLWEQDINQNFQLFSVVNGENVPTGRLSHNNNLFIPAEIAGSSSSYPYMVLDFYAISTGGAGSAASYDSIYTILTTYANGGTGACVFLENIRLRIKDENGTNIGYVASAIGKCTGISGVKNIDWQPYNDYANINNYVISTSGTFRTPMGDVPAGTRIFAMSSGGNSQKGPSYWDANGASVIYIPTKSVEEVSVSSLPNYTIGNNYTAGTYLRYSNTPYKVITNFTATSWVDDRSKVETVPNYSDSTQYYVGNMFYRNNVLYRVTKQFIGDMWNNVYGAADYFLKKTSLGRQVLNLGVRNSHNGGKDAPPIGNNPAPYVFTSANRTRLNAYWLDKSLTWGFGGGSGYYYISASGGAGLVMTFKGFGT